MANNKLLITGWDGVRVNLAELEAKIQRGAMRTAITKAGRVMLAAAKSKAPIRTGLLKRSLRQKVKTNTKKGEVLTLIGPSRRIQGTDKNGNKVRPARYAHLVEFGYGRQSPQPFIRPAYESSKDAALAKYRDELRPAIEQAAARIGKSFQRKK